MKDSHTAGESGFHTLALVSQQWFVHIIMAWPGMFFLGEWGTVGDGLEWERGRNEISWWKQRSLVWVGNLKNGVDRRQEHSWWNIYWSLGGWVWPVVCKEWGSEQWEGDHFVFFVNWGWGALPPTTESEVWTLSTTCTRGLGICVTPR